MTEQNKFTENDLHSLDADGSSGQTDKMQIELLGNFPYEWLFLMGNSAFCRKNMRITHTGKVKW